MLHTPSAPAMTCRAVAEPLRVQQDRGRRAGSLAASIGTPIDRQRCSAVRNKCFIAASLRDGQPHARLKPGRGVGSNFAALFKRKRQANPH
jgi:hypothetical protein